MEFWAFFLVFGGFVCGRFVWFDFVVVVVLVSLFWGFVEVFLFGFLFFFGASF